MQNSTGLIEVICGSMFSGKTEELLRRLERARIAKQKIQLFKPSLDVRYGKDTVKSHSSWTWTAENLEHPEEILSKLEDSTRVVGVDEAQFLDLSLVEIAQRLANRGLRVIVAGLDLDYKGIPFGPMPSLMAVAEQVTKLLAICTVCGGIAGRTQRLVKEEERILLGSVNEYEARCRRCFED